MKPTFLSLAIFALLQIQTIPLNAQNWNIAKRYSAPAGANITNSSVALAPDGSTYIVGNFRGTIDFDTVSISRPAGATDDYGFLLKLDAALQPQWARAFPQRTYDVTADAQGNVFVAGSQLASADDSLAFVAKYAPDGALLATFKSSGTADCWAKVVCTDAAGNCYIGGERYSAGQAIFAPFTMANVSSRQCFLVKLSPDLSQVQWATYTGASSNLDNIYDIEVDDNGFVYTSGNYSQNYSFGCFCYNGSFFTEKHHAATGISVWKKIFSNGSGTSTEQLLSLDSSGQSVFVSASFKNTTTFEPGLSLTAAANDDYHIYLAKMDAAGNVQWAKKVALTGDSYPSKMVRQNAELYLNGYFFSPTLMGDTLLTQQGTDVFLVETATSDGTVQSAEGFSGAGAEYGYGLDAQDSVMVVSGNSSSSNFIIGNLTLPGNTSSIYVARKGGFLQLPPVAAFSANTTSGCAPLAVQFTSTSTGSPTTFNWQFAGGTPATSTDPNPSVAYSTPGTYTVTLSVGNAAGANTATQTNLINVNPQPTATFTTSLNGLTATFTNASANASSYFWDFGDGNTSTQQNPAHTYANCDTYTVTLTSTNMCGTATSTASVTVGNGSPSAIFTSNVNGLTAIFSNTSANAVSYLWDFGDGNTSTQQNPAHTYANCDTYTVTLTSTNIC
ncbi:MAG: PKD domain-containing protein, partial [Saprospiraceae bacterium]